jgi:ABC-type sugar transport system permease subunit
MRRNINLGPLLIAPGFIFIFMFLIFPIFFGLGLSLFRLSYLQIKGFYGLRNFVTVMSRPESVNSIGRGLFMSLASAVATMVAGFVLAYWVNSRSGGFAYALQIVGLVPWVLSMVVGALLWKWMFAGDLGLLTYAGSFVGMKTIEPLQYKGSAMAALIFVVAWRTVGYSMVMLLAGLKTVPDELIEAANVDGAGPWRRIRSVILPLLKTPLLVSGITVSLSNINNVTVPLVLTGGGPVDSTNVVALELYRMGFVYNQYGGASALATIVLAINVILIAAYLRAVKWTL